MGIGDTELSLREVLYKLAKMSRYAKEGLNQVLFVTSGRFTEEERSTYNLLRKFIFGEEIVKYTTIIRTKFSNFRSHAKCKEDVEKMLEKGGELADVIRSCRNRIIHVDNSPLNVEDEEEINLNLKKCERSRTILLTHLAKCEDVYKPQNLDTLNERIDNYNTENEKLEKEIEKTRKKMLEQEEKLQRELNELQTKSNKQVQQLQGDKDRQMREVRENNERQMQQLQERNKQFEEDLRKLRLGIGVESNVSSALSSFYSLSEVRSTDFSSKNLANQVYYLKGEFERVIGENHEIKRSRDYWCEEEEKERERERKAEEKVEQLETRIEQFQQIAPILPIIGRGFFF